MMLVCPWDRCAGARSPTRLFPASNTNNAPPFSRSRSMTVARRATPPRGAPQPQGNKYPQVSLVCNTPSDKATSGRAATVGCTVGEGEGTREGVGEGAREAVGRGEINAIGSGEASVVPRGEDNGELVSVGSDSDSDRQPTKINKMTNKPTNHRLEIKAFKNRSVRLILCAPRFQSADSVAQYDHIGKHLLSLSNFSQRAINPRETSRLLCPWK